MWQETENKNYFPSDFDQVTLDGGFTSERGQMGIQGQNRFGSQSLMPSRDFGSFGIWPALLAGAAVGVMVALFWDPVAGRGRRARMRDKAIKAGHDLQWQAGRKARDFGHRLQGMQARLMNQALLDDQPDNAVLVARVRSALGHHAIHSRALSVEADQGVVTLRGPVLASELDEILQTVQSVRGVREVCSEMRVFESKEHVPGLQGESRIEKRQ